ncbi:hypothetical protein SORBI_3004G162300 [Sorghum bicolor]|uniref:Uncharacterized protein n=1 Tax=Sorghum bicolor TaxID=4558 RepID=A0A194YQ51_SORBI|nr:hypothetical protein SORBI_3004G162300 [Sorghum bicolor]
MGSSRAAGHVAVAQEDDTCADVREESHAGSLTFGPRHPKRPRNGRNSSQVTPDRAAPGDRSRTDRHASAGLTAGPAGWVSGWRAERSGHRRLPPGPGSAGARSKRGDRPRPEARAGHEPSKTTTDPYRFAAPTHARARTCPTATAIPDSCSSFLACFLPLPSSPPASRGIFIPPSPAPRLLIRSTRHATPPLPSPPSTPTRLDSSRGRSLARRVA